MDPLDRKIIGELATGEKTLPVITHNITKIDKPDYQFRKMYEKIKYRLQQMVDAKIIELTKGIYKIESCDHGNATIILQKEKEEDVITLDAGKTVFLNHEKGVTVVFLEETRD